MASICGKVACVTGGLSGIGYECAKQLLRNGIKAVLIADVNEKIAPDVISKLQGFGDGNVEFVKVDLTSMYQAECAFLKTVKMFKNLDIVINNAGILTEINYEKMIKVNYISVVYGTLLAMYKYIPQYKSGIDGVVINNASVFGLQPGYVTPVYTACKHALIGLGRGFGSRYYYNRYKVKVLTLCPGITPTPLIEEQNLDIDVKRFERENAHYPRQTVKYCGTCLIKMLEDGENGSVWISEAEECYKYPIKTYCKMKETRK